MTLTFHRPGDAGIPLFLPSTASVSQQLLPCPPLSHFTCYYLYVFTRVISFSALCSLSHSEQPVGVELIVSDIFIDFRRGKD